MPQNGYTSLFDGLLDGISVDYNTGYVGQPAGTLIYTGRIDEFYQYQFGKLNYRNVHFVEETYPIEDFQGNTGINNPEKKYPFVRVTEHKHFLNDASPSTIITKEFPTNVSGVPCYPVRDDENLDKLSKYEKLATEEESVLFGGRLGTFQYLDMDDIILEALKCTKENDCS